MLANATATPTNQNIKFLGMEIDTRSGRAGVPFVARQPCSAAATARGVASPPSTATCVIVELPAS